MKRYLPVLIVLAVLLALGSIPFLYSPVHDFIGRRNTDYSARFSADRYAQIAVGLSREKVEDLLGAPFTTVLLDTNYPPWAEGIQSLTFSRPKSGGDYDSVFVWIGADQKVRWHGRAVTD
ncbi:MAG: hypothetical protein QM813_27545 [Verrucomicrobiota bacterium]